MITSLEKGNVERSGTFEENAFEIVENAEMFDILSNKLYADAEVAVLREIGCNCLDSHTEAGKPDIPFIVELPNRFSPQLRFRDYGTGIKEEDMLDVYRKYGASTRRNSNNVIGQMGLGAKSPFALTDSFTVTSYVNGIKSTYSVFKDEGNIPTLAKLLSEKTDEDSGLEVIIPIKQDRFSELIKKASDVYQWFKNKPSIKPGVAFPTYTKVFEGKDFFIHSHTFDYYNKSIPHHAIMGNVSYLIEDTKRPDWLTKLGVKIEFPIGSLDIVPSREKLQYTKKTKLALETKINEIVIEISKTVQDQVKVAKSKYEAEWILSQNNKFGINEIDWNGKTIKVNSISLGNFCKTGRYGGPSKISIRNYSYNNWGMSDYMTHHMPFIFYFDDLERGGLTTVKREHKTIASAWYFKILKDDKDQPLATKQELIDKLGINESDFILTSSLPKAVIVRNKHGVSTKIQQFEDLGYSGDNRGNKWWKDTSVLATDTIYYFDLKEFKLPIKGIEYHPNQLSPIISWLVYYKLIPNGAYIYGVRSTVSDKMKANWINCTKLFEDNYDTLFLSEGIESSRKDWACSFFYFDRISKLQTTNKVINQLVQEWKDTLERVKRDESKLTIFKKLPIILQDVTGRDFQKELTQLLKPWPLINLIDETNWNKPEVIEYLNKENV